jgi:hypothetical protein
VIKHCISTLNFRLKAENERKSFEVYVTDALMAIASNTTHHMSLEGIVECGSTMTARYIDIIEPPPIEPIDERPCEEIAQDIFARIRGKK